MVHFVKKAIGELFHFESSNAIYHAINVTVLGKRETNSFPYVVRSSVHNGIKGYIVEPKDGLNSGNTISLAQDTGEFFYQEKSYFTGNKVKVLMPIGFELTKRCALYLMTAMQKAFYAFTWGSSFNTDVMKRVEVVVPVTDSGQLDVQYMEQYIKRIEAQYIKRIEAQYIKRIEAYLSVLGYDSIDDCKLSSQDLKVLSGPDEWGEFVLSGLFDYIEQGSRLKKSDQLPGDLPYVMSGITNQGIANYISNNLNLMPAGSLTVDILGNVFYRSYQYGLSDDVGCYYDKQYSYKQMLYLATSISKAMTGKYSYGKKFRSSQSSWIKIKLPVTSYGKPDYDFMDQYITAIEKKKVLKLKQAMDHKLELYRDVIHHN